MKILGLILVAVLLFSGCASVHRSEVIDTDKMEGYASGTYRDTTSGPNGSFTIAGGGGSVGGVGAGAMSVTSVVPPSGSYQFARAIAMINYSKKLKSIKYDETGRIIEYEFDQRPIGRASSYQPQAQSAQKSFGYQPVQ